MTNNNTDSSNGDGNAAAKNETTASNQTGARKRQQHKNQKNVQNAPKNKTQSQAARSTFKGSAAGSNPMKDIVIAQGNGNLSEQYRVYTNIMAGSAADDKAFGLDTVILNLKAKVRSDFIKDKPSPTAHSTLTAVIENGVATGANVLICHDPVLKDQMESEYHMDLKYQSSNWNQYQRHEEGFYRTAIGNVENEILTYCRRDPRMALVETKKDLVGFLLILRSVCTQNKGSVKVDEEYQNLVTLHQALSFRQNKKTNNTTFGENVLSRYESAIFTCGKFAFGQSTYDMVLKNVATPMTFAEYMVLTPEAQLPIDEVVKERIVARLIIKNSLNEQLKEYLIKTFSVNNTTCYPNTRSDAVSLLSTFASTQKNSTTSTTTTEDAVVSYHETEETDDEDMDDIEVQDEFEHDDGGNNDIIDAIEPNNEHQVNYHASVMATVIAEATAEYAEDDFFGASFAGLQDADDVYEDNEPDLVCYTHMGDPIEPIKSAATCLAHVVDRAANANGNSDEESSSEESNEIRNPSTIRKSPYVINHKHDFETVVYLTAQRVNNTGEDVRIKHYDTNRADLISLEYGSPTPEAIIDYSDVLRLKLQIAGICDIDDLTDIFEDCSVTDASTDIRMRMIAVCQTPLRTNTVSLLKEETYRHKAHLGYNSARYAVMCGEIGRDDEPIHYPAAHVLLHHTIVAVASFQQRRKPTRWINKVTRKMTECHINSREQLENVIRNNTINDVFQQYHKPSFHKMTINGFKHILGIEVNQGYIAGYTQDFRHGRS